MLILLIAAAAARGVVNLVASAFRSLRSARLPSRLAAPTHLLADYVIIDGLGAWVILCAAIVYLLASIYAVGYMRLLERA